MTISVWGKKIKNQYFLRFVVPLIATVLGQDLFHLIFGIVIYLLASTLQCNVINYNRIKGLIFESADMSADLATVTILIFKCELLLHRSWLAHGV